ncbi:MAG: adenylate kinase [bacterium]|nr:adenylate kinase [bacterium]
MKRIILFGAPGSGKGTQADALERKYGYKKISTGDLVRAEVAAETELGLQFRYLMERGELVPDEVIVRMFKNRLGQKDIETGYTLDGFPRTLSQARALSGIPAAEEIAVYLKVGDEAVVINRILSRMTCTQCGAMFSSREVPLKTEETCEVCGGVAKPRADDNEEIVMNRLRIYRQSTKPVIEYYKSKGELREVDACASIEAVFGAIEGVLN